MSRNLALDTIFAIVDLLTSIRDANTNTVLVQTGSVTEEYADCDNAEYWGTIGIASRPAQPVAKSSAAQGIAIRFGDRHRIIATRDVRGQEIYGNLGEGETCVYAGGRSLTVRRRGARTSSQRRQRFDGHDGRQHVRRQHHQ